MVFQDVDDEGIETSVRAVVDLAREADIFADDPERVHTLGTDLAEHPAIGGADQIGAEALVCAGDKRRVSRCGVGYLTAGRRPLSAEAVWVREAGEE